MLGEKLKILKEIFGNANLKEHGLSMKDIADFDDTDISAIIEYYNMYKCAKLDIASSNISTLIKLLQGIYDRKAQGINPDKGEQEETVYVIERNIAEIKNKIIVQSSKEEISTAIDILNTRIKYVHDCLDKYGRISNKSIIFNSEIKSKERAEIISRKLLKGEELAAQVLTKIGYGEDETSIVKVIDEHGCQSIVEYLDPFLENKEEYNEIKNTLNSFFKEILPIKLREIEIYLLMGIDTKSWLINYFLMSINNRCDRITTDKIETMKNIISNLVRIIEDDRGGTITTNCIYFLDDLYDQGIINDNDFLNYLKEQLVNHNNDEKNERILLGYPDKNNNPAEYYRIANHILSLEDTNDVYILNSLGRIFQILKEIENPEKNIRVIESILKNKYLENLDLIEKIVNIINESPEIDDEHIEYILSLVNNVVELTADEPTESEEKENKILIDLLDRVLKKDDGEDTELHYLRIDIINGLLPYANFSMLSITYIQTICNRLLETTDLNDANNIKIFLDNCTEYIENLSNEDKQEAVTDLSNLIELINTSDDGLVSYDELPERFRNNDMLIFNTSKDDGCIVYRDVNPFTLAEELSLDETYYLCNTLLNARDINSKTSIRVYYSINPSLALKKNKTKTREQGAGPAGTVVQ